MIIIRNKKDGELMFTVDFMKIARDIMDSAKNWSSFKIGKSGMTAEERFSEPDYNGVFDNIKVVYKSTSADNVSKMEAALIEYLKNNKKCDNIKDGKCSVNDSMTDSDEYIVYVVYKE